MRYIVYMIATLSALAVCGCSNGDDLTLPPSSDSSITIELEQARTYLGESVDGVRSVYWSVGDCIVANGATSSEAKIDSERLGVATFDFDSKIDYPCNILYPTSLYKDATTVTLPSLQYQTVDGTIDTNTLPMATCVVKEGEMPKLHHLAGVVHIQLRAYEDKWSDNIRLIEFWSGSECPNESVVPEVPHKQVSGDFTIDYATATLAPTSNKISAQKVGVVLDKELSVDKVTDVFIVVPAQEYEDGFTVRIMNEVGQYLDKIKPSSQSIAKGDILKMPEIVFIPTGTQIGVEIPNGNR